MKKSMYVGMLVAFAMVSLLFLSACGKTEELVKVKDLDFTVCDDSRLPKELVELIGQKKEQPFRLAYTTNSYMYIVVGYGAQNRDCLSVTLEELYLAEDGICIRTNLISETQEIKEDVITYPYIAVKCEKYELPVIYLD